MACICLDINECIDRTHMCPPEAQCLNQPGRYTCRCLTGYVGNGYSCKGNVVVVFVVFVLFIFVCLFGLVFTSDGNGYIFI